MSFAHIHTHTQYSLLDGAIKIPELIARVKELGMKAVAITDHGWMAGVISFYKECKKENISPLIGVEAYLTENPDNTEEKFRDNMHCILIAKDNIGYQKLFQVLSNAALHNFYYKPRVYKENLKELSGHVVCTSACLGGFLASYLEFQKDQYGRVIGCNPTIDIQKEIEFYIKIFGEDLYLEIQDWDSGDNMQPIYNQWIINQSKKFNLPTVITSDAHYLSKEDHKLHELLMAMQLKMTLGAYRELDEMQYGPYFYIKTPGEMLEGAKKWDEEAFYNTEKIANKCNVETELGIPKMPTFDITKANDYEDFLEWKKTNG